MKTKQKLSSVSNRLRSLLGIVFLTLAVNASAHEVESVTPSEIGIPYSWALELSANEHAHTTPDHVGAWSWDEDGFPATAKGWTHTSKWVKLELSEPVALTLKLENLANVPWPSPSEPNRLAGTNLFPSFTLYRGWDTDAGITVSTNGVTIDQDHTFNNRGNIAWAEDVTYLDHIDNSSQHEASRTWVLPAGRYTISLGGNSPATIAEGRQGYLATFTTKPTVGLARGMAIINYDQAAIHTLASAIGPSPVLELTGFFDQAAANSLPLSTLLTNAQTGFAYTNQPYAMNGPSVNNPAGRTAQPTTFAWVSGDPTNHSGSIGLGGIARFNVLGGLGGTLAFGDFTLQFDPARTALGGSGWYLKGNIEPAVAVYDLTQVKVVETTTSLTISGDLAVTFEVANFLYGTPGDTLKDVGDFTFTGLKDQLPAPRINAISKSGDNLIINVVNGRPGTGCVVLSSPLISAESSQWAPGATGVFDAAGTCSFSLPINSAEPTRFFKLRTP